MACNAKPFVSFGEMYPFVFADAPNETGSGPMGKRVLASLGDLRVRRPSKWPTRSLVQRSDGQHRVSNGGQRSHQHLHCASGASSRPLLRRSERGLRLKAQGAKELRKSALKSSKQFARVNLCAAPKQGSEADDSR
jgi:hypothetical protein